MKKNSKRTLVLVVCLCGFLTGCATWCELIERRLANEKYDEFAEMSRAEIYAFNADPKNEDKIICKSEKPTGSNLPQRTCIWESARKKRTEQDQHRAEQMMRRQTE